MKILEEGNKNSTVVSVVKKELRRAILDGSLKKGDRVIQSKWAERLNVSRMPIREALTQLQGEGLVEIVSHKGAVVTPITRDDFEEIYQTRALLEGLVVEKSLPFLTNEDKEELGRILNQMESLKLTDETSDQYIALNAEFHERIRKGCPWRRVHKIVETLGISPIAPTLLINYYDKTQQDHRRIYEAVMREDPLELRLAVEYHILRTKNNLMEYMEKLNQAKSLECSEAGPD
ncbi:GntR family transcriptional regulator [Psychrobacillus soli]|uniref:GntR family transcriptional regulator n=2 Tax=Psychrobacillus soli TaxID=1543965 RepID=A0A544TN56_9BACI|nr:GntR family transcriptional regulator [Psychrobacillus soli]